METISAKSLSLFGATAFSFELPSNSLVALIGNNGSGKTTLLRALMGEKDRVVGEIHCALPITDIAFVPQEHEYPEQLNVWDLLMLAYLPKMGWFGSRPASSEGEARSVCDSLQITKLNARLGQLRSGDRQRVFLARALLQSPKLLLLDEPTNHLDPLGVDLFWNTLSRWQKAQQSLVLVSTHDLAFVRGLAGYVLALKSGTLLFGGAPSALFQDGGHQTIFGISADPGPR